MNKLILIGTLALLTGCATGTATNTKALQTLEGATVLAVVRPSMGSGVLMAFAEIKVLVRKKEVLLVAPYGDERQSLPIVGSRCTFRYEKDDIEGVVGLGFSKIRGALVVRERDCP